jgi:hypothetical protein
MLGKNKHQQQSSNTRGSTLCVQPPGTPHRQATYSAARALERAARIVTSDWSTPILTAASL